MALVMVAEQAVPKGSQPGIQILENFVGYLGFDRVRRDL
jgi:hypothetical protein